MEEDCNEVEKECAVLEAIYWDCTIVKTYHCTNGLKEPELQITVVPLSDPAEVYVQLDLTIWLHIGYPQILPSIGVKNCTNLSETHVGQLKDSLKLLAEQLIGQTSMLHELVQLTKTFLVEHNSKPMSCHEEMLKMQQQRSKDLEVEKQLQLQEMCLTEKDEIKRIEMELKRKKEEFRKLKKRDIAKITGSNDDDDDVTKSSLENNSNVVNKVDFLEADELTGSRLKDDFEVLEKLGRGGFGDVIKVQNRLDGRYYAIKRIPLDPRNRGVTCKITREVKLLSRLNHENVVRYYNSWVETWQGGKSSAHHSTSERVTIDSSADIFDYSYGSDDEDTTTEEDEEDEEDTVDTVGDGKAVTQYLYIQMEYCEKSTLKDVIEADVYKDEARVWRLFREVVEGLVHIHDQGIIHRDLKPVNIFMDSNNHLKIGDFGLATSASDSTTTDVGVRTRLEAKRVTGDFMQRSLTSNVGTALYASPEIVSIESSYNQKVDLYSLGIILFEMSYKRFETLMERHRVLSALRSACIAMPADADQFIGLPQRSIISWLLNHNPSLRPTARELLSSEHLPPPAFDEDFFDQALISAVRNCKSHAHKSLLNTIFSQQTTTAVDYAYDHYMTKSHSIVSKRSVWQLVEAMAVVFARHGACHVDTPLLLPLPNNVYSSLDHCAKLMNSAGNVVVLPHDTKVSFARFVEKANLEKLKRFSFCKLFRESLLNLHPREVWVASYDVVAPANSEAGIINDLDIFLVLKNLLEHLQVSERQFELKFNHRGVVAALLSHCGVAKEQHHDVFIVLNEHKNDSQRKARLLNLGVEEEAYNRFASLSRKEGSVADISSHLKAIIGHSSLEGNSIKNILSYMEKLFSLMDTCAIKFKTSVSLSLTTEISLYSGIFFQFARCLKRKVDVVAVGGSFSSLFHHFRQLGRISNTNKHAFGMTIYLERLLSEPSVAEAMQRQAYVDMVLMSYQPSAFLQTTTSLLTSLRGMGHRCVFFNKEGCSFDEVKSHCKFHNVPYLLLVDSDVSLYKIDEKDKLICREKKQSKLLEFIKKRSQQEERKARKVSCNEDLQDGELSDHTHIDIPPVDIKLVGSDKPYCFANRVLHHTHETLLKFNRRNEVRILVTDLQKRLLKALASQIEVKENSSFLSIINSVCKEFPRERKYLTKVVDEIVALNLNRNQILILYSASDDYYKVVL